MTKDAGNRAAILEVVNFVGSDSLGMDQEAILHKQRALALRALDNEAQRLRGSEAFPPSERLTLLDAVLEMERVAKMDPHDAEAWNYCAAWYGLLEQYDEAIAAADRAIKLRPVRYARPHVNKAHALYFTDRQPEALASVKEALRQAELEQSSQEIAQARTLITKYSAPARPPSWEEIMPVIDRVLQSARLDSDAELAQIPWASVEQLAKTILKQAASLRGQRERLWFRRSRNFWAISRQRRRSWSRCTSL